MESRFVVFVLLIFGSLVVMAKPAWEDKEDSGLPGKISVEYMENGRTGLPTKTAYHLMS